METERWRLDGSGKNSIWIKIRLLDRDIRQVHADVQTLHEYRIVHFREAGGAKQPFVPYDTVKIEVELTKSFGDASESPTSA